MSYEVVNTDSVGREVQITVIETSSEISLYISDSVLLLDLIFFRVSTFEITHDLFLLTKK